MATAPILAFSASVRSRTNRAGTPAHSWPAGTTLPVAGMGGERREERGEMGRDRLRGRQKKRVKVKVRDREGCIREREEEERTEVK